MSATEDFINSLSDEDRKILEESRNKPEEGQEKDPNEVAIETYTRILDMQIASGKIPESERGQILSDFIHGKD